MKVGIVDLVGISSIAHGVVVVLVVVLVVESQAEGDVGIWRWRVVLGWVVVFIFGRKWIQFQPTCFGSFVVVVTFVDSS